MHTLEPAARELPRESALARALRCTPGMSNAAASEKTRRLPENTAQMWHRAREIHRSLPSVAPVSVGAVWRERIARELPEGDARVSASVMRAIAAAKNPPTAEAVFQLARNPIVRAFPSKMQRTMFDHLSANAALARELLDLISRPELGATSDRVQRALLDAFFMFGTLRSARAQLLELAASAGFVALDASEQLELVRYCRGPKPAVEIAAMRKNRLELWWGSRREELIMCMRAPAFRTASPALQGELLRDFLHEARREVRLLDATELNGHAAIVFGDPADPRSWSYGRRFVVGKDGRPSARICCPDATVYSGWKTPAVDATTLYSSVSLRVSRRTELMLIEWIERAYAIAEDLRIRAVLGPSQLTAERGSFVEQTMAALLRLTAGAGGNAPQVTRGYARAGKPVAATTKASAVDLECDRELAAFLKRA